MTIPILVLIFILLVIMFLLRPTGYPRPDKVKSNIVLLKPYQDEKYDFVYTFGDFDNGKAWSARIKHFDYNNQSIVYYYWFCDKEKQICYGTLYNLNSLKEAYEAVYHNILNKNCS
jgi:hypothetical protein